MFERILVPLDGTPLAEEALRPALSLARMGDSEIHLATVTQPVRAEFSDMVPGVADDAVDDSYMEKVAARVREAGVARVSIATLAGSNVADCLEAHRRKVGADLVVMCTHGRGAVQRAWLGSVADALVRVSEAPVLLIRGDPGEEVSSPDLQAEMRFQRVLVPLDGSHFSRQALSHAARLAGDEGATYVLARVIEASGRSSPGLDKARPLAEAKLKLEVQSFESNGRAIESAVEFAPSVAQGILDLARSQAADAIVIATHGLSGVKRLVLGSVADKVVRGADVPVLVVRPAA